MGVSYKLLDKLTLSASVLDLGFIKWSKSNTSIARANAEQTYDLLDPASQQEFMNIVNSGEILNYDMLKLKTEEASEKSRTRGLTSTMVSQSLFMISFSGKSSSSAIFATFGV